MAHEQLLQRGRGRGEALDARSREDLHDLPQLGGVNLTGDPVVADLQEEAVTLRFGDITIPHLKVEEPLRLECQHFLECLRNRRQPLSDGMDGLRVLRILEAAQRSLKANGMPMATDSTINGQAKNAFDRAQLTAATGS